MRSAERYKPTLTLCTQVPDVFLVHFNTYDEAKPKAKYGHFPTDWLIGESCWPPFRDRVAAAYNYSYYCLLYTSPSPRD